MNSDAMMYILIGAMLTLSIVSMVETIGPAISRWRKGIGD